MNRETLKLIIEKSKLKANSVYSFRGVLYRVINNHVVFLFDTGSIYQFSYGFLCHIVDCERFEAKNKLKSLDV